MRHLLLAAPFALLATPAAASTGEPVNPWVALAYLISGVFFILALRGLSSPATSQTGNRFGMVGMLIAVVTTLVTHVPGSTIVVFDDGPTQTWFELDWATTSQILIAIAIGAAIGLVTARRIAMTAMPELVAAFHSLVGLAAVLVGWAAYLNPGAFGLLTDAGIAAVSKVEMGLGIAIGAITFSGSVIAFAKLSGKMSGSPILLPARHVINLGVLAAIIVLTALFAMAGPAETLPLIIALTVLGLVYLVLDFVRAAYTDWLWFSNLGLRSVFSTVLYTRISLYFVGFAISAAATSQPYASAPGTLLHCAPPSVEK